ncbi:Fic family protein [Candidatus Saccharibacteria bacterium]|nr:Fic family protein [Candidatus Saccharibacteria bacterium]
MSGFVIVTAMNTTTRQQQIMASLITGSHTLPQLIALPTFQDITERTLQRDINELLAQQLIERHGEARAINYQVTAIGRMNLTLATDQLEALFAEENRQSIQYDFGRLDVLAAQSLFSQHETDQLNVYNSAFQQKLQTASTDIIRRERERITIELSWKSSQFEGNTYSLLETETLLKEGIPAKGKTQEETTMVLNHKKALDFSEEHKDNFHSNLQVQTIIELHKILAEGLFNNGLRERLVGITGSVYQPLQNKFQLEDELKHLCEIINTKQSVYEKALLAFTYICYLQPFNDGNKRTGRILANAILYAHDSFPLSLRAVDVNDYKLAILAFYELGLLGNVKKVFIDQAKFATENYAV